MLFRKQIIIEDTKLYLRKRMKNPLMSKLLVDEISFMASKSGFYLHKSRYKSSSKMVTLLRTN